MLKLKLNKRLKGKLSKSREAVEKREILIAVRVKSINLPCKTNLQKYCFLQFNLFGFYLRLIYL